ncbi:hypothetical protein ABMA79_04425 [Halobacteriovorax sp. HFRX-2_2]|uniref:hypothetical protein n=1 Tax=unclassified Halobacteriovorax TaxID=2639665 RepID=UPI0037132F33
MKVLISLLMLLPAFGAGLQIGNDLASNPVEGSIRLTCNDRNQHQIRYVNCSANYLSPSEFSRFVLDEGERVDADEVTLYYKDHKGRKKSKSSSFDAEKGESSKKFNLWIYTLLQRPLLNYYGENEIEYKLEKNGREVATGKFIVNVEKQDTKYCQSASYWSSNMDDCRFPQNFCARYFRDYNYCQ